MGRKCAYCGIPQLAGANDEVDSVPGDRLDKEISFAGDIAAVGVHEDDDIDLWRECCDTSKAGGTVSSLRLGHDRGPGRSRYTCGAVRRAVIDYDDRCECFSRKFFENPTECLLFIEGRDDEGCCHYRASPYANDWFGGLSCVLGCLPLCRWCDSPIVVSARAVQRMDDRLLHMTATAALLERPLLELAIGATSLGCASAIASLLFFWIGFRIAEVPVLAGFERMFGLADENSIGSARVVPHEVATRLKMIQERATTTADRVSLDELATAMGREKAERLSASAKQDPAKASRRDL